MGLSQALSISTQGLRTTQSGLALVAGNVANAQTPGYVRKTLVQETTFAGDSGSGVRNVGVNRTLDVYLQRQLRSETSGSAYADLQAQYYASLQRIYGDPSSDSSLENVYNNFTTALQGLATSPADNSARASVLSTAQVLAQQLNGLTNQIQGLRTDAENALASAVQDANQAMQRIAEINQKLIASPTPDAARAALLDQRDQYVDQLSKLMDVRVSEDGSNQLQVFTRSGFELVGQKAAVLSFDAQGTVTANSLWSADPAERGVGTISSKLPSGGSVDLLASGAINSGEIAALVAMRDKTLVQAQTQIDEFAGALSRALSDHTAAGTPATVGAQNGFDIDIGGLQPGNSITVTYKDATSTVRTVSIVRVDDPSVLPLSNTATTNPNDKVIGINWSGGTASVVAQLNAAFGGQLQFSNPSGTTLRVLDDGAANNTDVNAVSATTTMTSLSGGTAELPFFVDGGLPYSGAISSTGSQTVGFAGRITVNPALVADASRLVVYQPGAATGDPMRPTFIYDQLTAAALTFSPATGLGSADSPYVATLPAFMRQVLSQQGDAAASAQSLSDGQTMVLNALKQRFDDESGVNIDQEMTNLLTLQTAYGANARVMTTIKDLMERLLEI